MLILTRRPGDILLIEPHPNTIGSDPSAWFVRPIEVRILRIEGKHVRIGVEAAEGLRIWRGERLVGKE
jgi:sRNA-binding carbon storage regulator CsrA